MKEKPYIVIGERNSWLLHQYGTLDSFRHKIPGTKWDISKTFIYAKNLRGAHCYHEPTRRKMLEILTKELIKGVYDKKFFAKIHKSFRGTVTDIEKFTDECFSEKTEETLARYYLRYYRIYQLVFLPMMVSIYSSDLQDFFERELEKALKDDSKDQEKKIEIISFLLTPSRLTEVQKEEQLLLVVQNKFARFAKGKKFVRKTFEKFRRKQEVRTLLQKLESEHGWFHQEYTGKAMKKKDYAESVWKTLRARGNSPQILSKHVFPEARIKNALARQKRFFVVHGNELLRKIVTAMQEFALLLDYSKADLIYGIYIARPLIEEIKKRFGLSTWVDVHNLTPEEVVAALDRGGLTAKDRKNIRERRKEFAMLYDNGKIFIYHGAKARHIKKKLLREEKTKGIREFGGLTAMTGKVQGTARIVVSFRDAKKFRDGDIMITNEVTTELTSVLKKASAIVADGGGIISHTAIVAREFKTPCIVGTKIATKVLQDGEKIEVDATGPAGTVRLLPN